MEKNKKFLIGGLIGLLVILLIISFSIGDKEESSESDTKLSNDAQTIIANAQKESQSVSDSEKKEFNQINMDTYLEYYAGDEYKLVLIARPTCTYCQIAEPIIQNVAYENNIEINYLNTDNFEGDDTIRLRDSNEMFSEGFGTPLLLIVGKNEIKDKINGLTDKAHYIEFFKVYGYIK